MSSLFLVVVLGVTVLVGTTLGRRWSVAPPILLICFGGLLALIPALSGVRLPADTVLVIFLPALLYWESLNASLREIRENLRVIILSAVVLVIATMIVVSFSLRALGVAASAAWILGAVLAPTDASAVAGLAKRMPRRNLVTLRTESLINDSTALVLFAAALGMLAGSTPSALELTGRLLWSSAGALLAGLAAGGVVIFIRRRVDDPRLEGGLSIVTPFLAFLLAEVLHASGVVAVVTCGLLLSYVSPNIIRARSRVEAFAFWDLSTFMLNGSLFVLVGMQVPRAVRGIESAAMPHAVAVALAATAAVMLTRLLWVHASTVVVRTLDRRAVQRTRRVNWRVRTANGWAGFRGAVSLAAALAVPVTLADATPYAERNLIVFTTVVVIVLTMVVQGLTLPFVIRWAGLVGDNARADETRRAQESATRAGLEALDEAARRLDAPEAMVERIRSDYEEHLRDIEAGDNGDSSVHSSHNLEHRLRLMVLERKRQAVTRMRDANEIDDIVLRDLQAAMDIEELRLVGQGPSE